MPQVYPSTSVYGRAAEGWERSPGLPSDAKQPGNHEQALVLDRQPDLAGIRWSCPRSNLLRCCCPGYLIGQRDPFRGKMRRATSAGQVPHPVPRGNPLLSRWLHPCLADNFKVKVSLLLTLRRKNQVS